MVNGVLDAAVALLGAVAEPDQPVAGMAQMVGGLVLRGGGDAGERRVVRPGRLLPERRGISAVEQLPRDRHREIAVRLLDQQHIAELWRIAQVGERVLITALALDRASIIVERARLTDQVEPDIGERQFLFEQRRVTAPFRQPVPEDQRIVGETEHVVEKRRRQHANLLPLSRSGRHRGPHMSPTSFGTV